jgi:hypothetical protein
MKGPVTPNAYRKAKSLARQCQREYEIRRALFLSTRSIFGRGNILARESEIDRVLVARQDRDAARSYVKQLESRGIETGAAWSPNGLRNVRAANASR